jgi:hypothetical protein
LLRKALLNVTSDPVTLAIAAADFARSKPFQRKGWEKYEDLGINISPRLFQRIGDVFGVPQVGRTVRAAATSNIQDLAQ